MRGFGSLAVLWLGTLLASAVAADEVQQPEPAVVTSVTLRTASGGTATLAVPEGMGLGTRRWSLNSAVSDVLAAEGVPTAVYLRKDGSVATLWWGDT
jgi:hypothetical protein